MLDIESKENNKDVPWTRNFTSSVLAGFTMNVDYSRQRVVAMQQILDGGHGEGEIVKASQVFRKNLTHGKKRLEAQR